MIHVFILVSHLLRLEPRIDHEKCTNVWKIALFKTMRNLKMIFRLFPTNSSNSRCWLAGWDRNMNYVVTCTWWWNENTAKNKEKRNCTPFEIVNWIGFEVRSRYLSCKNMNHFLRIWNKIYFLLLFLVDSYRYTCIYFYLITLIHFSLDFVQRFAQTQQTD